MNNKVQLKNEIWQHKISVERRIPFDELKIFQEKGLIKSVKNTLNCCLALVVVKRS